MLKSLSCFAFAESIAGNGQTEGAEQDGGGGGDDGWGYGNVCTGGYS